MAAPQRKDAIFDYVTIEAGCLDNPGVRMKGVPISEGPLYAICNKHWPQGEYSGDSKHLI